MMCLQTWQPGMGAFYAACEAPDRTKAEREQSRAGEIVASGVLLLSMVRYMFKLPRGRRLAQKGEGRGAFL